jgi:hypothetical protein
MYISRVYLPLDKGDHPCGFFHLPTYFSFTPDKEGHALKNALYRTHKTRTPNNTIKTVF